MSENTPQDPTDNAPETAEPPQAKPAAGDNNALGNLLNKVSARADEKRAEISQQLQTEQEVRAREERESTEKRRQDLLRKREKAIKKRQTQLLTPPKIEGSDGISHTGDHAQVPVAEFDLTVKNSKPAWLWVALLILVGGSGGAFALLKIGETHGFEGNVEEAAAAYAELVARYPEANQSAEAKRRLEQLTDDADARIANISVDG